MPLIATIAAPIAKGGPKPLIFFVTEAMETAGLRLRNSLRGFLFLQIGNDLRPITTVCGLIAGDVAAGKRIVVCELERSKW
jgi:hypothetical protein